VNLVKPEGGTLEYVQVFGTLLIAVIVAGITWAMQRRQVEIANRAAKTAQHKLNLDLFDKRWTVYDVARRLIGTVVVRGNIEAHELQQFLDCTQGAKWLFDDDVADYLKTFLYDNAIDLQTYVADARGLPPGQDLTETRQKITDLKKLFNEELKLIDDRMGKFMRIVE
jgi:tRNA isopentenyl-2-thiomethyl-A-37 hydroxylase MiaE